ncbi:hypothetical protein CU098_006118, partial [Rhizopus stolonifer]
MLLVTSADEYLGFCVTSHLSQFESLRNHLRILYHKTKDEPNSTLVANFSRKGIDVRPVDYMHPNDLSKAFHKVDQMILTVGSHPDRVKHCRHLCRVAIRSGIRSIIFLSHIGAHSKNHESLNDYGLIEDYLVEQQQICEEQDMDRGRSFNWTILRLDWIQQYFHLWACQIESRKSIGLPLAHDTKICPVDISDVCHVVASLVTNQEGSLLSDVHDVHASQSYTLTGPEAITSKELIDMISHATRFKQIKYQMMRPMDTVFYLKSLSHNIWYDERIKKEKSRIYFDSLDNGHMYRLNAFTVPNDVHVQRFLDYFDWVSKTSGSFPVEDTRLLLTHKEPSSIQDFFLENANSFKPR